MGSRTWSVGNPKLCSDQVDEWVTVLAKLAFTGSVDLVGVELAGLEEPLIAVIYVLYPGTRRIPDRLGAEQLHLHQSLPERRPSTFEPLALGSVLLLVTVELLPHAIEIFAPGLILTVLHVVPLQSVGTTATPEPTVML